MDEYRTVAVPAALHRDLKIYGAIHGVDMKSMVAEAVAMFLSVKQSAPELKKGPVK